MIGEAADALPSAIASTPTASDGAVERDPAVRARLAELAFVQDRMLHVIGHALWTPAAAVHGLAQAIADGREVTPELADSLVRSSSRLTRALDDVLIAAEVETRFPIDREAEADLVGNLRTVWDDLGSSIAMAIHAPGRLDVAVGPASLRRLLHHVLDNAARYADQQVYLDVTSVGGRAVVTVVNDGLQLETDDQRRAFELFYRGQAAVVAEAAGLGLGLSVARLLARRAAGDITIAARHEGGATVTIALPLVGAP